MPPAPALVVIRPGLPTQTPGTAPRLHLHGTLDPSSRPPRTDTSSSPPPCHPPSIPVAPVRPSSTTPTSTTPTPLPPAPACTPVGRPVPLIALSRFLPRISVAETSAYKQYEDRWGAERDCKTRVRPRSEHAAINRQADAMLRLPRRLSYGAWEMAKHVLNTWIVSYGAWDMAKHVLNTWIGRLD